MTNATPDRVRADHIRSFLSGSAFSAGGMAVSGVLTMVTGVVLARWLNPDGFGTYSLLAAIATFVAGFGAAGLDFAAARFVAYYLGGGESRLLRGVIGYCIQWTMALSAGVALLVFAVFSSGVLGGTRLASAVPYAALVAAAVPLLAVQGVVLQAVLALHAVRTRVLLEKTALPLLRLGLPFALLLFFSDKVAAAAGSYAVGSLLVTGAAALLLRRSLKRLPPGAVATPEARREWRRYALPYVFFSVQSFISAGLGIDVLLVGVLRSVAESGVYAACFRFTLVLLLARAGMDYAFGPKVGSFYGKSDLESIRRLYGLSSSIGLAWTLPCAVVLMLFSRPLLSTFFGPVYGAGAVALAVLALGFAADGAAGCYTTLLSMIGRPWLVLTNGISGGILAVVLCLVLIPQYGMVGAAAAISVSRFATAVMGTFEIWWIHGIHPFSRSLSTPFAAAGFACAVGYLCRLGMPPKGAHTLLLLLGSLSGVFVAYLLALFFLRFSFNACFERPSRAGMEVV